MVHGTSDKTNKIKFGIPCFRDPVSPLPFYRVSVCVSVCHIESIMESFNVKAQLLCKFTS